MTSSTDQVAQRLARLERAVKQGTVGQLGHSSFEGGGITQYNSDGSQVIARFGEQYDGTGGLVQLSGPMPPQPAGVSAAPVMGGIKVTYRGGFVPDGSGTSVVAPLDFSHFNIYASIQGPDFIADRDNVRLSIPSAQGGEVTLTVTTENEWWIRVAAVSKAGKVGPASLAVGPVRAAGITADDLDFDPADFAGTTIFYGPSADFDGGEPTAVGTGDLWLAEVNPGPPTKYETRRWDGADWTPVLDQAVSDSLAQALAAQQAAASKAKIFTQPTPPADLGPTETGMWFDSDDGNRPRSWSGTAWVDRRLGSGAIQPNSLIASDVIATGTVSAALLETLLVLTTQVVAGDPDGTHARMTPTGFRVFREDLIDGIPDEVARLGTDTDDYFAIVDGDGALVGSWDATSAINARTANFTEAVTIGGISLTDLIAQAGGGGGPGTMHPGARTTIGWHENAVINGVTSEIGLIEVSVEVEADRLYWIVPSLYWSRNADQVYLAMSVRDGGTGAPTISSPVITTDYFSGGQSIGWTVLAERHRLWKFSTSGTHRLLLTVSGGGGSINVANTLPPTLAVVDLGPYRGNPASVNRGGGSTPPPVKQYYVDLAPSGWTSYSGSGAARTDVAGPVQGWDPSGYNGDGSGFWWFPVPSITGIVDRVDFYAYTSHWYYNSGGTARLNIVRGGAGFPVSDAKLTAGADYPGWPKPGGLTVTLPQSWWSRFADGNGPNKAVGVSVGAAGTTDLTYYGRFDGPSARLRIWYTQ